MKDKVKTDIYRSIDQFFAEDRAFFKKKEFTEMLRYSYFDSTDPMLLFLFRAKSLKESESQRISTLLAALNEQALTAIELLDVCCKDIQTDSSLPDEKTVRNDLKYLEEVGVIKKAPGPRPYRYRIHNDLIQEQGMVSRNIVWKA
ncbi:hypothetical protein [Paenibacillus alginolyticus]|uniref:hypothetical protein n=1 Tax=Paenibacillus alginolyticus TaxID=59839 RepID=UPI0028A5BBD3|nr:hypothetical protein [Paenibacillus frigoriresistens]